MNDNNNNNEDFETDDFQDDDEQLENISVDDNDNLETDSDNDDEEIIHDDDGYFSINFESDHYSALNSFRNRIVSEQQGYCPPLLKIEFARFCHTVGNDIPQVRLLMSEICNYSNKNSNFITFHIYDPQDTTMIPEILYILQQNSHIKHYVFQFVPFSSNNFANFFNFNRGDDATKQSHENRSIEVVTCDNDDTIPLRVSNAIENCSFFNSWKIERLDREDVEFLLNALARNQFIQSLHIIHTHYHFDENMNAMIDKLTSLVTLNKVLTKLFVELDEDNDFCFNSIPAATALAEALIKSESISELTFLNMKFKDQETFQAFVEVFKRKQNIQFLRLGWSFFLLEDSYSLDSSLFSNLTATENMNNNRLRELDIEIPIDLSGAKRVNDNEIQSLFLLIRDSAVETLTVRTNDEMFRLDEDDLPDNGIEPGECFIFKRLFQDTVPFMMYLRCFKVYIKHPLTNELRDDYIKYIGRCTPYLVKSKVIQTDSHPERSHAQFTIQKYIKRNTKLVGCCKDIADWPKNALLKFLLVAKPTGPDVIFRALCSLGDTIGPDQGSEIMEQKMSVKRGHFHDDQLNFAV